MTNELQDINISEITTIARPSEIKAEFPSTEVNRQVVLEGREAVKNICQKKDTRKLLIIGPCSIHDPELALEYARKLKALRDKTKSKLEIMMRVYFEKPRTTIGWKGLINDPEINQTYDIERGLRLARKLLLEITALGVPIASEILDPVTPQFISDLMSWGSIGARTTESQGHREIASGLSMPVGFKNTTNGSPDLAINGMKAACHEHSFIGVNQEGQISIVRTTGNPDTHLILRGGDQSPNYDPTSINEAAAKLQKAGQCDQLIIDCSHGNSRKKHVNQPIVCRNVVAQIKNGNPHIMGMMIESNLEEGNQPIGTNKSELKYGVSITDECIGWNTTEALVTSIFDEL